MTIGEELRQLRTNLELTQEGMADLIGVERGLLSKWERNIVQPSAGVLTLLECIATEPRKMLKIIKSPERKRLFGSEAEPKPAEITS